MNQFLNRVVVLLVLLFPVPGTVYAQNPVTTSSRFDSRTARLVHEVFAGTSGASHEILLQPAALQPPRNPAPLPFADTAEPEFRHELEAEESPWDEPIETDRHDFTQSPRVVGRGVRQVEFGVLYAAKNEGTEQEQTWATPELAFRYGIRERVELRARFNHAWKFISDEDVIEGTEDLRLGLKLQITEPCRWRPESALELRMAVPTGSDDVTTGVWSPGIDYIYAWELGEFFTLAGSTGANANGLGDITFIDPEVNRGDRFTTWSQSAALGARLTRRTTGYFEWFGLFTDGRDEDVSLGFLNFGVDYLLNCNTVVDFRIGWGLNDQSDDIFAGIGGGFRF